MKRLFAGLLALVWACGGETVVPVPNEPPVVIGSLADQELYIDETVAIDLDSIFADPEADTLTYGVNHADSVVSSLLTSRAELAIRAERQGSADIVVAASDSAGNTTELEFRVTVLNRDPLLVLDVEDQYLYVDSTKVLNLDGHFIDPDFDPLTYEAVSNSPDLEVETSGDDLTIVALGAGRTSVEITVSDDHGGELKHRFIVSMANTPVSVWRDDFDRDSIGDDWTEAGFRGNALLVEERLRTNVIFWDFRMEAAVDVEEDWLIVTNIVVQDEICPTIDLRVHSKNFRRWFIRLNPESGEWSVSVQTPDTDWHQLASGSSSFTYGEASTVTLGMTGGTRMHLTIDGVREGGFNPADSPEWPGGAVPHKVFAVGIGGTECFGSEGGVEFDWFEIFRTEG